MICALTKENNLWWIGQTFYRYASGRVYVQCTLIVYSSLANKEIQLIPQNSSGPVFEDILNVKLFTRASAFHVHACAPTHRKLVQISKRSSRIMYISSLNYA